jgi:DNA gyrase subunit A
MVTGGTNDSALKELLEKNFLTYSMSVICRRALPNITDGLKPVHRRILWAMKILNLTPRSKFKKSARIVGDTIGKYHPHGPGSVYGAMVRMAQSWVMSQTLVRGQGNFGSVDGDPPAAMRYTEARLAPLATYLLQDTDPLYVDFQPNFDDSEIEPKSLGAAYPNLLINGSDGIAVGMSTRMYPHNLHEVIMACIWHIDNYDVLAGIVNLDQRTEEAIKGYMTFIKGPDFPTGGEVYGLDGVKEGFLTGRGSFRVRAVFEVKEDAKKKQTLIIKELPYGTNKATLLQKIIQLVKDGAIDGISDLRDESTDDIRIVMEIKRGAEADVVKNHLLTKADLDVSLGYLNLVIINGRPEQASLYQLIHHWLEHRVGVVTKRLENELTVSKKDAHIKQGIIKAIPIIGKVIKIIRDASTDGEIIDKLTSQHPFSEEQARVVKDMPLSKLSRFARDKLKDEVVKLEARIKEIEDILGDKNKLLALIKEELNNIKDKVKAPRLSGVSDDPVGRVSMKKLVKEDDVVVSLTADNYIRRVPLEDYRVQHRKGKGSRGVTMKDQDTVIDAFVCSTHDAIMFFTNTGRVYKVQAWDIPSGDKKSKGLPLVNLIPIGQADPNEEVRKILPFQEFDDQRLLLFFTRKGMVKATTLSDYKNIRKTGIGAIFFNDGDELLDVHLSHGFDENPATDKFVMMATSISKGNRFVLDSVRVTSRVTKGVRGIWLPDKVKDNCVGATVVSEDDQVFLLTKEGWGKRCPVDQFGVKNRGTQGMLCKNKHTDRGGDLFGIYKISPDDEVLLISKKGQTIRIEAEEIKEMWRNTVGVRLIDLDKTKDEIVSASIFKPMNGGVSDDPDPDSSDDDVATSASGSKPSAQGKGSSDDDDNGQDGLGDDDDSAAVFPYEIDTGDDDDDDFEEDDDEDDDEDDLVDDLEDDDDDDQYDLDDL